MRSKIKKKKIPT